jgi:hypothetical protein
LHKKFLSYLGVITHAMVNKTKTVQLLMVIFSSKRKTSTALTDLKRLDEICRTSNLSHFHYPGLYPVSVIVLFGDVSRVGLQNESGRRLV